MKRILIAGLLLLAASMSCAQSSKSPVKKSDLDYFERRIKSWVGFNFAEREGWNDMDLSLSAKTTGTNVPTFEAWLFDSLVTTRGVWFYSFPYDEAAAQKELAFKMSMPANWAGDTLIFHVHWIGNITDSSAHPSWGIEYTMAEIGTTYPYTQTIYSDGDNIAGDGVIDTNVVAKRHYVSLFDTIRATSSQNGISSYLVGRLFRNSGTEPDTYDTAGNKCGLLGFGVYYKIKGSGSSTPFVR